MRPFVVGAEEEIGTGVTSLRGSLDDSHGVGPRLGCTEHHGVELLAGCAPLVLEAHQVVHGLSEGLAGMVANSPWNAWVISVNYPLTIGCHCNGVGLLVPVPEVGAVLNGSELVVGVADGHDVLCRHSRVIL